MAFEKFIKKGTASAAKVSIRKNGTIGFTSGAITMFELEKYKFAVFYYDKADKKIGIKLTSDKEEGSYKLQLKKSAGFIAAVAFLNYYGIDFSKKVNYTAEWDAKNKMIVISLA
ncbi:MAG: hypothetical protein HZB62_04950 [Nitrospirae bacterium]|nr:hypothetical protein [Nitrospirota bacterium]